MRAVKVSAPLPRGVTAPVSVSEQKIQIIILILKRGPCLLRINGVTIPPDLASTAQKPDLVIVKRKSKEVKLVELTIPWDSSNNMAAAVLRKTDRYQGLCTEIMGNGYKCDNTPLEVGTRGMINQRNKAVITNLCQDMKIKKASNVIKTCSKLALLGSYTLWNARFSNDWTSGGYLKP